MRPRELEAFPIPALLLLAVLVPICLSISMHTKTEYYAMSYTCTNATRPLHGNTYAPCVPQPSQSGDIVGFDLQNNQPSTLPAHYITFGEAFMEGNVPSGDRIQADINGVIVPAQLDVKTTYPDGSAEYGIVTLQQPSIPAHTTLFGMLQLNLTGIPPANISISNLLTDGYNLQVGMNVMLYGAEGPPLSFEDTVSLPGSGTFSTGQFPAAAYYAPLTIALSPSGATAYIVLNGNGTVIVMDTSTKQVTHIITLPGADEDYSTSPYATKPYSIVVNPSGTTAYVSESNQSTVAVLNLATYQVTNTITLGADSGELAMSPSGAYVYAMNTNPNTGGCVSGSISVINTTTNQFAYNITGLEDNPACPSAFAVTPNGKYAYVAEFNEIAVVNLTSKQITTSIPYSPSYVPYPATVAVNPQGTIAYVLSGDALYLINTATNHIVRNITGMSSTPEGITINPSGTLGYIEEQSGGTIYVVSLTSNKSISVLPIPTTNDYYDNYPEGAAISSNGQYLYLPDEYADAISVINLQNTGSTYYSVNALSVLSTRLTQHNYSYWLQGPLATQVRVDQPINSSMHIAFDITLYADGSSSTNIEFDNDYAMQPVGGFFDYNATVAQNGNIILNQSNLFQVQYTTWNFTAWPGGAPQVNIIHDMAELERLGAIPPYNLTAGLNTTDLQSFTEGLTAAGTNAILGNGYIDQEMGGTGARYDIGPTTGWAASWILTQNQLAEGATLLNAKDSGSIPWHFYDPQTGAYITSQQWPNITNSPPGSDCGVAITCLTQGINLTNGWAVDPAHEPDLSYDAYLLTGSRYFLDQLNAQVIYNILDYQPGSASSGSGLNRSVVVGYGMQVRAAAWNIRTLDEAVYIDPSSYALKSYLEKLQSFNFDELLQMTHTTWEGQEYGWIPGVEGANDDNATSCGQDTGSIGGIYPYMEDYLGTSIVMAAEQGVPGASQFLDWETNWLAGRFLQSSSGFNGPDAVDYGLYMCNSTTGTPLKTWAELAVTQVDLNSTWPQRAASSGQPLYNGSWSDAGYGLLYPEIAYGMIQGIINVDHNATAIAAWDYLTDNGALNSGYNTEPSPGPPPGAISPQVMSGGNWQAFQFNFGPVSLTGVPLSAGILEPQSDKIDSGQSLTFTTYPSGGTYPYTYKWYSSSSGSPACSSADLISGATSSTYSASPTSNTYYTYLVTDSASPADTACSAVSLVTVEPAFTVPTIATSPSLPATLAPGQSIKLTASWSGGTSTYTVNYILANSITGKILSSQSFMGLTGTSNSLTWTIPATDSGNTIEANVFITDNASTPETFNSIYAKTLTLSAACSASISSPSNTIVDIGQYETFVGSEDNCVSPYTYNIFLVKSISPSTVLHNDRASSSATSLTYTIQVTSADMANSPEEANVVVKDSGANTVASSYSSAFTVNPTIGVSISPSTTQTIYASQQVQFTSTVSGGSSPYSYQWYSGGSSTCTSDSAINGATSNTYTASPSSNTIYCLKATDDATTPVAMYSSTTEVIVLSGFLPINTSTTTSTSSTVSPTTTSPGPQGGSGGGGGGGGGSGGTFKPTVSLYNSTCYEIFNLTNPGFAVAIFTTGSFFIRDNYVSPTNIGVSIDNLTSYTLDANSTPTTIGLSQDYISTIQLANISYIPAIHTASVYVCVKPLLTSLIGINTTLGGGMETHPANTTANSSQAPPTKRTGPGAASILSLTVQSFTSVVKSGDLIVASTSVPNDTVAIYAGGAQEVSGKGSAMFNTTILPIGNYTLEACDNTAGICSQLYTLSIVPPPQPLSQEAKKENPIKWKTTVAIVLIGMSLIIVLGRYAIQRRFKPPVHEVKIERARPPAETPRPPGN